MNAELDTQESRRAAARRYLATAPLIDQMIGQALGAMDALPEPAKQRMIRAFRDRAELLEEILVTCLVQHFSTAEIDAMTRFYASPEGRSAMKKLPLFLADAMTRFEPVRQRMAEEEIGRASC